MNPIVHNSNTACPNRNRNSAFRIPHSALIPSAFTLVELLIVIAIIGVLTAMSLTMLAGASNDAKISATQARISQITSILQLQMEDYEVRRLPISNRVLNAYVTASGNQIGSMPPRLQLKYLRRQVLMALIDSEMPRPLRRQVSGQPIEYLENEFAGQLSSGFNLMDDSALAGAAEKHVGLFGIGASTFDAWLAENYDVTVTIGGFTGDLSTLLNSVTSGGARKFRRQLDATTPPEDTDELDLPGEYLHEILRSIQIDGQSAVELLGNSAIGNTDDDTYPEVVDAWGDPLLFDIEQFSATVDGDNSVRSNSNGFVPLDPRYPMALGDLQIVVGSSRIPESLPVVERISRGVE